MNKFKIVILCLIAITNCIGQNIITDRPDQTESSSVINCGAIQVESGILISEDNNINHLYGPSTLFRIGILKNLELRLLSQYEYQTDNNFLTKGFNDIELGVKIQLLNNEIKPVEIAFLSHLIIPSGSMGMSEHQIGIVNKLCISHRSTNKLSFAYNLGYDVFHNSDTLDNSNNQLTYSFVSAFEINNKVNIYIEPYGEIITKKPTINQDQAITSNINAGVTYLVNKNLQLDYSFGTGLDNQSNFMSIGCSIKFE